ncbi:MAG: SRPBCC family protein [Flavobacteriaceae bacterium]|nr:SRPBCC family protein [Flavobacteriaceae bacterium]
MQLLIYILAVVALILIIVILIAPNEYSLSRSIIIDKPHKEVFQYLKLIKNQEHWSPWKKKDPNMTQEFIGEDGKVGFVSKWKGNKDVGEGEQEILTIIENELVETQLRFFKPWKSQSIGTLMVAKVEDDQTLVTWGFSGRNPTPFNVFMLFYDMDKTVGKDFEEGLADLKRLLEHKK